MDHRVMCLRHMVNGLSNVWQERVQWVRVEWRGREGMATMEQVLMVEDLINMERLCCCLGC